MDEAARRNSNFEIQEYNVKQILDNGGMVVTDSSAQHQNQDGKAENKNKDDDDILSRSTVMADQNH